MLIALAVLYPLAAHLAVARNSEHLAMASLAMLAALVLSPALARGGRLAWLTAALVVMGLIWAADTEIAWLPLYAPPVVISLGMAWLFGRSLAPGEVPIIERIVKHLHSPDEQLDAGILGYARRLTLLWVLLFSVLSLTNLALALCATPGGILLWLGARPPVAVPREIWSLFANLLNYVIIAVFFIIEYIYRRWRFPQQPYANIFDFIRRAMAIGPRIFGAMRERA